jgi:hypothetical protein
MSDDGLLPAALTAMATADAMPCVATIPFMWRLHLAFHGVRLSRLPQDDLATACGDMHVTYWATMADGLLAGVESAPVEVRVNMRAASFVLRTLGLESAEIRADRTGALSAVHVAQQTSPRATPSCADRGKLQPATRHLVCP